MTNRNIPSLTALRAFEAAARHGQMSRAADELNVTHGAVSRQVKQLENALGVALFRRAGTGVALTEAGAGLLPVLTTAFDLIENGVARVSRHDGGITVSCLGTFTMRWLIPRLYDFRTLHPEIDVRLSADDAPVDFGRDGIDLAIRVARPPWPANTIVTPFIVEQVAPVLSVDLQARLQIHTPEDLARATLLHTETRRDAWADWLSAVDCTAIDARGGESFEHFYFLLQAAASGLGVAIGPHPLVADDIAAGRLVAPLEFRDTGLCYVIMRPPVDNASVEAFETWIVAQAAAWQRG